MTSSSSSIISVVVILCLLLLSGNCLAEEEPVRASSFPEESSDNDFSWSSIAPSRDLVFHACFERMRCARLLLPLDWQAAPSEDAFNEEAYNETVAIAITVLPAKVPATHRAYGGPILINPGGPGGSGTEMVRRAGALLQLIVDDDKSFDIVGFDPRGVPSSTPNAFCFPEQGMRDIYTLRREAEGILDAGEHVLPLQWARAQALGALCRNAEEGGVGQGRIRRFMSTASVARDMLAIVDKMDEHHQRRLRKSSNGRQSQSRLGHGEDRKTAPAKLQYWGFSYGTFLGATFASLYPDRIQRMVLDGVVDTTDYSSAAWSKNLHDTEKTMAYFYSTCYDAGPRCPLHDAAGPQAIRARVEALIAHLHEHPIVGIVPAELMPVIRPGIITYSDIRSIIFRALYDPVSTYPTLASILAGLERGNYTETVGLLEDYRAGQCSLRDPAHHNGAASFYEVSPAVYCGDGDDITDRTPAEYRALLHELQRQSPSVGAIWALLPLACTGWPFRPKWRFAGPFTGTTSAPILWIGNTMDPVTPLANAYTMARRFQSGGDGGGSSSGGNGGRVLTLDGAGHCSLSAPSACLIGVLKRYFDDATLPAEGTVCKATIKPFVGVEQSATVEGNVETVKGDVEGMEKVWSVGLMAGKWDFVYDAITGRRWPGR